MAQASRSLLVYLAITAVIAGGMGAAYYLLIAKPEAQQAVLAPPAKVEIGKDTLKQLKSLGYVN